MDLQYDLQSFLKRSKEYHSDLSFLHDEVMFLKHFLKSNYPSTFSDLRISRPHLLNNRLVELKLVMDNVTKDILVHQGNLQSVINNVVLVKSLDFLKMESERIEDEIRDLNHNLKRIKKELFTLYKNVSASNQQMTSEAQLD
ncbi:MAG TPA: hypothetical protein VL125_06265 [Pelobium sp.]|nr:hypothetical protein [Pelobium sp.]